MTSHEKFISVIRYMHISNLFVLVRSIYITDYFQMGCQDRLRVNSDDDEALA